MKPLVFSALRTATGVVLGVVAAIAASLILSGKTGAALVPLIFAVLLIVLSSRFGALTSIAGSLFAAVIFATIPIHRPHVADAAGRGSLVWMILIAVVGSYLLFPNPDAGRDESGTISRPTSRQQH